MEDLNIYLDHLKNSREFMLGSRLRQSFVFKTIRHIRLRKSLVSVQTLGHSNPKALTSEVCLLGIWSEEYPHGMPFEFLERNPRKWRTVIEDSSPYRTALITTSKDVFAVYSQHENLRLDFRMDQFSGMIRVKANGISKVFDLYAPESAIMSVFPNRGEIEVSIANSNITRSKEDVSSRISHPILLKQNKFTSRDLMWLEKQRGSPQPLSVNNPVWRGILSSAQELFNEVYFIQDDLDREKANYFAHLFKEAGNPSIVIQGFPLTYHHLVKAIRKTNPGLPIFVIYHGNFLYLREDYEWKSFKMIMDLYGDKDISKVGFVKRGMAEMMTSSGVNSAFIMNIVRRIPARPSPPMTGGPHVAIWSQPDWSWKKAPYAMLAALSMIPNSTGHAYNVSSRVGEFAQLLSLNIEYVNHLLPQAKVLEVFGQMHLNLYVTLAECAPMLPLESLSVGSPCLIGPNTHYFWDNDYLYRRLVVEKPDDSDVIAEKANLVLNERNQVIEAYREYAPEYNQRALKALSDFLEFPIK